MSHTELKSQLKKHYTSLFLRKTQYTLIGYTSLVMWLRCFTRLGRNHSNTWRLAIHRALTYNKKILLCKNTDKKLHNIQFYIITMLRKS